MLAVIGCKKVNTNSHYFHDLGAKRIECSYHLNADISTLLGWYLKYIYWELLTSPWHHASVFTTLSSVLTACLIAFLIAFFVGFSGGLVKMDVFAVQQRQTQHTICEAFFFLKSGEALLNLWFPPVLHLLPSVCPFPMHHFKEHQENPFLSLSLDSFDTCVSVWGFYALGCATHTHTETPRAHTHTNKTRMGWNTHLYINTNTPPVCSAVNTMIVFWPHFLQGGDKSFFHSHGWNEIQLYL